jgi:hypothetical protein
VTPLNRQDLVRPDLDATIRYWTGSPPAAQVAYHLLGEVAALAQTDQHDPPGGHLVAR